MKSNIVSLNPMDRNFFGKPLVQWAAERTNLSTRAPKFVESSIDDFNKYFDFMTQALRKGQRQLERVPDVDVYVPNVRPTTLEDSFGPSF